jgi:hypothetical protein
MMPSKSYNEHFERNLRPVGMGAVAKFWHEVDGSVDHADAATLEMFEGVTQEQINDALCRFDSHGNPIRTQSSFGTIKIRHESQDADQ